MPRLFGFCRLTGVRYDGAVQQLTMPKRAYEPMFDMEIGTFSRSARFAQTVTLTVPEAEVRADVEWMICNDNTCMPPEDTELTVVLKAATPSQPSEGGSLWAFIIEAILWGFAAMLTPCVFPMIPMTVSYFLKGEGGAPRADACSIVRPFHRGALHGAYRSHYPCDPSVGR